MAWRFVRQPNGLYGRFSEVVDHFIHANMTFEQAYSYALECDMTPLEAEQKVKRADEEPNRYQEAIETISRQHGVSVAEQFVRDCAPENPPDSSD